jgi:hypothetical protein
VLLAQLPQSLLVPYFQIKHQFPLAFYCQAMSDQSLH